jgi:hypothetical protein
MSPSLFFCDVPIARRRIRPLHGEMDIAVLTLQICDTARACTVIDFAWINSEPPPRHFLPID